jgi:hypothetical protein
MRKESKGRVCSFEAPFAFSDVIRATAYEQNRAGSTASTTYLSYLIEREHCCSPRCCCLRTCMVLRIAGVDSAV